MEKRIDCPLCGKDVYPNSASGKARNNETGKIFIVCVDCDGATHTPEPDNCDHKPQYREWLPIDDYNLKERQKAVFWCKFENTIWIGVVGYLRYAAGDTDSPFIVTPVKNEYGRRTHLTHYMPLPDAPKEGE